MTPYIYAGLEDISKRLFSRKLFRNDPEYIINCVSEALHIETNLLSSPTRKQEVTEARCICISLILNANPKLSLKKVGSMFNRDHSTIIYNRDLFKDLNGRDRNFTIKINKVKELL